MTLEDHEDEHDEYEGSHEDFDPEDAGKNWDEKGLVGDLFLW